MPIMPMVDPQLTAQIKQLKASYKDALGLKKRKNRKRDSKVRIVSDCKARRRPDTNRLDPSLLQAPKLLLLLHTISDNPWRILHLAAKFPWRICLFSS